MSVTIVLGQHAYLVLKPGDGRSLDAVHVNCSVLTCFAVSKDKYLI
jgi:hypothetical protein